MGQSGGADEVAASEDVVTLEGVRTDAELTAVEPEDVGAAESGALKDWYGDAVDDDAKLEDIGDGGSGEVEAALELVVGDWYGGVIDEVTDREDATVGESKGLEVALWLAFED